MVRGFAPRTAQGDDLLRAKRQLRLERLQPDVLSKLIRAEDTLQRLSFPRSIRTVTKSYRPRTFVAPATPHPVNLQPEDCK